MLSGLGQALPGDPRAREGAPTLVIPATGFTHRALFPAGPSLLHPYPNLVFLIVTQVTLAIFGISYCWPRYLSGIGFAKLDSPENPSAPLWVPVKFGCFCPTLPLITCKIPHPSRCHPHRCFASCSVSLLCSHFSPRVLQFSVSTLFAKLQARESHWPAPLPAALTGQKWHYFRNTEVM